MVKRTDQYFKHTFNNVRRNHAAAIPTSLPHHAAVLLVAALKARLACSTGVIEGFGSMLTSTQKRPPDLHTGWTLRSVESWDNEALQCAAATDVAAAFFRSPRFPIRKPRADSGRDLRRLPVDSQEEYLRHTFRGIGGYVTRTFSEACIAPYMQMDVLLLRTRSCKL